MKKQFPTYYIALTAIVILIFILLCCTKSKEASETVMETQPAESAAVYPALREESHFGTFTDPESQRTMDYHIYFSENATECMPLIVYLHGTGAVGNAAYNELNPAIEKALEAYGNDFPFILLAPSSMFKSTWRLDHMPYLVKSLIDDIASKYNVDRTKIIIMGHSMGAGGVMRQIELFGDYYSAAVPVSLTNTDNVDISGCLNVPIWGFAGTEESPYDYNMQKLFVEINDSGGKALFSALEGAEHGNSAEYAFTRAVFAWAMAQ